MELLALRNIAAPSKIYGGSMRYGCRELVKSCIIIDDYDLEGLAIGFGAPKNLLKGRAATDENGANGALIRSNVYGVNFS